MRLANVKIGSPIAGADKRTPGLYPSRKLDTKLVSVV